MGITGNDLFAAENFSCNHCKELSDGILNDLPCGCQNFYDVLYNSGEETHDPELKEWEVEQQVEEFRRRLEGYSTHP